MTGDGATAWGCPGSQVPVLGMGLMPSRSGPDSPPPLPLPLPSGMYQRTQLASQGSLAPTSLMVPKSLPLVSRDSPPQWLPSPSWGQTLYQPARARGAVLSPHSHPLQAVLSGWDRRSDTPPLRADRGQSEGTEGWRASPGPGEGRRLGCFLPQRREVTQEPRGPTSPAEAAVG